MKLIPVLALGLWSANIGFVSAQAPPPSSAAPALTIYNQNFAVVRQTLPLTLKAGLNHVTVSDITAHVEPDSVILRDPTGKRALQVREQNYRADPLTQDLLLSYFVGQSIPFVVTHGDRIETIQGKIIRSGYTSTGYPYSQGYYQSQPSSQPIVEIDGKVQFGLPGVPQFPTLPSDGILKPTLDWTLEANQSGPLSVELAYVTEGMTWSASYNLVAPETDTGTMDMVGWVTMQNHSGKTFPDARIKLMAGDVNKVAPNNPYRFSTGALALDFASRSDLGPPVTEKAFDEYHLYTLPYPATLRDGQTKQIEFVKGMGIRYKELYVYDGASVGPGQYNWTYDSVHTEPYYGTQFSPKVAVMREFVNSRANGLGIPLPEGRVRFYKRDADGQLEFIGENTIDHTPKDETLRVYTGNAFDLVGERTQTAFKSEYGSRSADESFTIKVRNHKKEPVEVRIVEHLYRGETWTISAHSDLFLKTDSHTIEFHVSLTPDEEKTVTYTAHYTW